MRLLVISDIHGNLAALEAVAAESHDAVVCLGDIVGYGPEPGACLRWIRSRPGLAVQGNHDRALAEGTPPGCRAQFRVLADATAPIGRRQTGPAELAWLAGLPRWAFLTVAGVRFMFVHATPRDPLYEYLGPDAARWQDEVRATDADVVVVGHTHLQFQLRAGSRRVINPGSVGQPKDGDPRAAYAVIDDGIVTLHRVAYPVERTIDALRERGMSADVVAALSELLRTGRVPATTPMADDARRAASSSND